MPVFKFTFCVKRTAEGTIEILNEKLVTHRLDQAKLHSANDALLSANSLLKQELAALKHKFLKKEEDHKSQLLMCSNESHQQGHFDAVEELKTVWDSKEFAAELMYGKQSPKAKIILNNRRRERSNSQSIRCHSSSHGLRVPNTKPAREEGLDKEKIFEIPKVIVPISALLQGGLEVCTKDVQRIRIGRAIEQA